MIRHPILTLLFLSPLAHAAKPEINSSTYGGAIDGYDPVAYFTERKPIKGTSAYAFEYKGAKWLFASKKNRQAFKKSPQKYTPQYGGYCAYAVSKGSTAPTDPNAWTIHNGKLYLNYNADIRAKWREDIAGNIDKADSYWPKVLE